MKQIIYSFLLSTLWTQQLEFVPFDWAGQFGYVNKNGAILWNEDWRSNRLLFDGTWAIYPRLFGPEIEDGFLNQSPNTSNFDSSRVTSYFKYDQGDYLLDRFSFGTNYNGNGRQVHLHAFKRSYAGPYNQYDNDSHQPLQQTYTAFYESKKGKDHAGISVGHFNTYSGLADSTTRGLIDNRITTANTFWDRSFGVFNSKISIDQFLQRYKSNHSMAAFSGVRYLTRSRIKSVLTWKQSENMNLFSTLEINTRNTKLDSQNTVRWNRLVIGGDWMGFKVKAGLAENGGETEPEFNFSYRKIFHSLSGKILVKRDAFPIHVNSFPDPSKNLSLTTSTIGDIRWTGKKSQVSASLSTINYQRIALPEFPENEAYTTAGFTCQTTLIPLLELAANYSHQLEKSFISDGIKDKLKVGTKTRVQLFDNFMNLDASLSLNGWLNREPAVYMHLTEMVPVRNDGSGELNELTKEDIWFINGSITAYVSTFTIKYEWFNISEMILASMGSEQDNYFEIHPKIPRLGRQVNLSVEWHFLD